jgi:hypothetical protein
MSGSGIEYVPKAASEWGAVERELQDEPTRRVVMTRELVRRRFAHADAVEAAEALDAKLEAIFSGVETGVRS